MQHVAYDGHAQIGEVFLEMPDGVNIEQTLRGMRVAAITRVNHMHVAARTVNVFCNQERRTALRMPHHKHVGMHGDQIVDGVE